MEANELRLGNLLYQWRTDICFEVGIDDLKIIQSGESKARPIPLTEEWAVKFGYECLIEMACDFSGNYSSEITSDELKKLYVHQAQNLFFALTGEELKLIY
jgi:hypothetical protein